MAVDKYSLEPSTSLFSLRFLLKVRSLAKPEKTTRRVEMAGFDSLPPLCRKQRRGLSEKEKRRHARWVLECASLVQGLQDFLVDHGPAGIGEPLGEAPRNRCRPGR
jgi:hypothetical protein